MLKGHPHVGPQARGAGVHSLHSLEPLQAPRPGPFHLPHPGPKWADAGSLVFSLFSEASQHLCFEMRPFFRIKAARAMQTRGAFLKRIQEKQSPGTPTPGHRSPLQLRIPRRLRSLRGPEQSPHHRTVSKQAFYTRSLCFGQCLAILKPWRTLVNFLSFLIFFHRRHFHTWDSWPAGVHCGGRSCIPSRGLLLLELATGTAILVVQGLSHLT